MTIQKRKRSGIKTAFPTYVIDTSVLVHSGESLFSFGKSNIVIPLSVLDELDTFKTSPNEKGRNSRFVIRSLRELSKKGDLSKGVILEGGGSLIVSTYTNEDIPAPVVHDMVDNRILGLCLYLKNKGLQDVILVTKDISLATKAQILGIFSEDYTGNDDRHQEDELYTGYTSITMKDSSLDLLYELGLVATDLKLFPNEFVILSSDLNPKKTALAKYSRGAFMLVRKNSLWGLKPRNVQQTFAVELLRDDACSLVTLSGLAGSGKTLLAVAAGLQKVIEERKYDKLIVTRPTLAVGDELGFLPGTIDEKYEPWIRPIKDALGVLFEGRDVDSQFYSLSSNGTIKIEPLSYIRGRTFHNAFMILDESQNLTRHQMKTFLTRIGEGTKVVLTGDTKQIDNISVDSISNGLTQVVERFKGQDMFGHVSLERGERSTLASKAADLL